MMDDRDDWGPWVQHDGLGCPCVGMFVEVVHGILNLKLIIPVVRGRRGWSSHANESPVIRYRIRKPRGMALLEAIARDVPDALPADHPCAPMEAREARISAAWDALKEGDV